MDLSALDKSHVWHPFTRMEEWCAPDYDPLFITRGEGACVYDAQGREYLDGNSTIWTNIHGHRHPRIDAALREQLEHIAHVSALGFANAPAARLAAALCALWPAGSLTRAFFTDDGSTAIECALKMALQYHQQNGRPDKCRFAAFDRAYHGDTLGAAALGGIPVFHGRFQAFGLQVEHAGSLAGLEALPPDQCATLAAVVIEPLIQGAAGMQLWPPGMLAALRRWCDARDVFLICDEVMTGFGRTGKMFASEHEGVIPDFLCVAKGLTGGYLPLAATLTTERVFRGFLSDAQTDRTFYYGHSYTGNPLGCAAALANLEIFREERTLEHLQPKITHLTEALSDLRGQHPQHIGAVRQCGFIAGIDILENAVTGTPWPATRRMGAAICQAARAHGLLTRPVRDTLVLMPPLCTTRAQLDRAVAALSQAIRDTLTRA